MLFIANCLLCSVAPRPTNAHSLIPLDLQNIVSFLFYLVLDMIFVEPKPLELQRYMNISFVGWIKKSCYSSALLLYMFWHKGICIVCYKTVHMFYCDTTITRSSMYQTVLTNFRCKPPASRSHAPRKLRPCGRPLDQSQLSVADLGDLG